MIFLIKVLDILFKELRNLLTPFSCGYCRHFLSLEEPLCIFCLQLIKPTLSTRLLLSPDFSLQVYAVSSYEEPLKTMILAKHSRAYEKSKHLGILIVRFLGATSLKADYLIPVPLHPRRLAIRGYNQAQVIAEQISMASGIPLFDGLIRTRNTPPQAECPRHEKYGNVEGAFRVLSPELVAGKSIILIDDLMTSGATLGEAARALIPCGPAHMRAIVACISTSQL
jgi:ComF family protein